MTRNLPYISSQDLMKVKAETQVLAIRNNYLRKKSEIPKSIKIFFLILHLVFGQDFGFRNLFGRKTSEFLKFYSSILTSTMIIILVLPFKLVSQDIWYWGPLMGGAANFYILKTTKYSVYNFLSDIHAAERIDVLEKEVFGVVTAVYATVMLIAKILEFPFYCLFDSNVFCEINHIYLIFYAIFCHAVDAIYEAPIVVRFYMYGYVKNMERSLKQVQDINKFVVKYDKIADWQDKIRRVCDCLMLLQLLINVPKLLAAVWYMLNYANKKHKWYIAMCECVIAFHLAIQIVIPAVIVQLIKCSLDDIRQLLSKWSMVETDPEKNAKIVRVMKYLKRRNLYYKIWGIIPTDLNLPLTLISIATTYFIVIIQYTHLYD